MHSAVLVHRIDYMSKNRVARLLLTWMALTCMAAATSAQSCPEQLAPDACLYDVSSSLRENVERAYVRAYTDIRNPRNGGLASATALQELLAELTATELVQTLTDSLNRLLLTVFTAEELCDEVQLALGHTSLALDSAGVLTGTLAFARARQARCYQRGQHPHIKLAVVARAAGVRLRPERPLAEFKRSAPHTDPMDLASARGRWRTDERLAFYTDARSGSNYVMCVSCLDAPNAVPLTYSAQGGHELGVPRALDDVGLYSVVQRAAQPGAVPVEFKVVDITEELVDYAPAWYVTLELYTVGTSTKSHSRRPGERVRLRVAADQVTGNLSYEAHLTLGRVYAGVLANERLEAFTPLVDYLSLPGRLQQLDSRLGFVRPPAQSGTVSLAGVHHDARHDLLELKLRPHVRGSAFGEVAAFSATVHYDTTLLGTHLVGRQQVLARSTDSGQAASLRLQAGHTVGTQRVDSVVLSVPVTTVTGDTSRYRVVVRDASPTSLRIEAQVEAGQQSLTAFHRGYRHAFMHQLPLPDVTVALSARSVAEGEGPWFTLSQNPDTVRAYVYARRRTPVLTSVSATRYRPGDVLTFTGRNLADKGVTIWVPCALADPRAGLIGYCNVQPWHQRGQPKTATEQGYIVPETYSVGMSGRRDLVPRSGEVLVGKRSSSASGTGFYLEYTPKLTGDE